MDPREKLFLGAWQLQTWTVQLTDGSTRAPFGDDPSGTLVYAQSRAMSVNFMARRRPPLDLAGRMRARCRRVALGTEPNDPSDAKLQSAMASFAAIAPTYLGYSGTYSINGGQVIHHVETSFLPEWVGTDLVREFEISEHHLELVAGSAGEQHTLQWQRI